MHCRPKMELPKELEDFISKSENGFIYFSFGSIVQSKTMPKELTRIFINVFKDLKQQVIWKWDGDNITDLPMNVKISSWLPQQDLLGHHQIKLFITHGGLLSLQEAVYHGVPLLGIPFCGDQVMNMANSESQGWTLTLELQELTEEILNNKIQTLLHSTSYRKRVKELSLIFRDQSETPLERAVFWTEYVLRHKGANHLRSSARNLNYIQFHSYDVIGTLVLLLIFIIFIFRFMCLKIVSIISFLLLQNPYTSVTKKLQ